MSDINFEIGAVCYANGEQWILNEDAICNNKPIANEGGSDFVGFESIMRRDDFQLNEIKVGDYLPKSELDTEQKYNDVVEVFGLFGFSGFMTVNDYSASVGDVFKLIYIKDTRFMMCNKHANLKRKLTYHQIIAIGKLKRMMFERERSKGGYIDEIPDNTAEFDAIVSSKSVGMGEYFSDRVGTAKALNIEINGKPVKPKRSNKSKQAYDILKSLDYEYDLFKQRWYKKEYI